MTGTQWMIRAQEFANCNCSYGCPCQFNGLPTYDFCQAIVGIAISEGFHGKTNLDGLKVAGVFAWPGPIHHGKGQAMVVIDKRADQAQRDALLRILSGQDTEPGATIFAVFASTLEKLHDPIFTDIEFEVDVEKRRARLKVDGRIDARGEPILNPVTGAEHRVRIDSPNGFEYKLAEIGRGWSKSYAPLPISHSDSYAQFCNLHMNQSGLIS